MNLRQTNGHSVTCPYRESLEKNEALYDALHRIAGKAKRAGQMTTLAAYDRAEARLHECILGSRRGRLESCRSSAHQPLQRVHIPYLFLFLALFLTNQNNFYFSLLLRHHYQSPLGIEFPRQARHVPSAFVNITILNHTHTHIHSHKKKNNFSTPP